MKTKYNALLKVRKQELDKAEKNLQLARQRQLHNELEFQKASLEYAHFNLPTQGSTRILQQALQMLDRAKIHKFQSQEKLLLSQKEVVHYQHLYKKAFVDYEKIQYLQNEEIKQRQKALKKQEEQMLDEMAVIKYFYEGKKNV